MRAAMAVAVAGIVLLVTACDAGARPPSAPASSHASPSAPMAAATPTTEPATLPPTLPPSPSASAPPPSDGQPARPDPATFLQVCWMLDEPAARPPVPCPDAVETALAEPGLDVAAVTRVDVRTGCAGPAACPTPDPDVVEVTVLAGGRATLVEVTRGDDDALAVTKVGAGEQPSAPAFTAPAPGRATLPGAPRGLAARPAYPFCGQEATPMGGPYDGPARTCFLSGVLAGSPVEFASVGSGTEGGSYVHLYRYAGAGGVEFVSGEGGRWQRAFTGIAEAGGGLVFDIGGMATRREPVR